MSYVGLFELNNVIIQWQTTSRSSKLGILRAR